jgi:hypothetical protein
VPMLGPTESAVRLPMPQGDPEIQRVSATSVAGDPAVSTSNENLLKFDPNLVQAERRNQHWVVAAGDLVIKDFGNDSSDAYEAARLIHTLKLNQLGKIGSPHTVMEYWLTNGQAPPLPMGSPRAQPLDPAGLRVEQDRNFGRWIVRNNSRVIFTSFTQEDDARQALQVIRDHGFTHVITLGQSKPAMQLFVNGAGSATFSQIAARPPEQTSLASGSTATSGSPIPGHSLALGQGSGSDIFHGPASFSKTESEITIRPASASQGSGIDVANHPSDLAAKFPDMLTPTTDPRLDGPRHDTTAPGNLPPTMGLQASEMPHRKGSMSAKPSERVPFDFRQAALRKDSNGYVLACGSQVLATFGSDQDNATRSLSMLRSYQLNEMHRVGGGQSQFAYFLASGKAPMTSGMIGVRSYPVDVPHLQIKQENQNFIIANAQQSLWRFNNSDDAQTALGEIQKFDFDRIYYFGNGEGTGFMLLAKSR